MVAGKELKKMSEPIDFYFDFSSPYGFIAAMQIERVAARANRTVRWRPFLLGAVFKKVGQSPLEHDLKREYINKLDVFRSARMRGLVIKTPRGWPEHSIPPARIFYWIEPRDPAEAARYAHAAYTAYWIDGNSTADADIAVDVAARLGLDRAQAAAAIQAPAIKQRLVEENEAVIARGVFGSPFIFVDGEPFWGSDRLDQVAIRLEKGSV
jgi:2-hydroxychromene-2-carboxylate isomerase